MDTKGAKEEQCSIRGERRRFARVTLQAKLDAAYKRIRELELICLDLSSGSGDGARIEDEVQGRLDLAKPALRCIVAAGQAGPSQGAVSGNKKAFRNFALHSDMGCGAGALPRSAAEAKTRGRGGRNMARDSAQCGHELAHSGSDVTNRSGKQKPHEDILRRVSLLEAQFQRIAALEATSTDFTVLSKRSDEEAYLTGKRDVGVHVDSTLFSGFSSYDAGCQVATAAHDAETQATVETANQDVQTQKFDSDIASNGVQIDGHKRSGDVNRADDSNPGQHQELCLGT